MKISEVVKFLEEYKAQYGDVELFMEHNDGKSTWSEAFNVKVKFRKIWPNHPTEPRYYLEGM